VLTTFDKPDPPPERRLTNTHTACRPPDLIVKTFPKQDLPATTCPATACPLPALLLLALLLSALPLYYICPATT